MAKEKETSEPGLGGPIFAAILSIMIGGFLAAANLAILPVSVVKELPPEEERAPRTVFYITGADKGGNTWKQKRTFLERGQKGTLLLGEGELNRWSKSTFKPDPKKAEDGGIFAKISLIPEPPNFRIANDQIQISSQLAIPIFGEGKRFIYQATGNFVNESGVNTFKAKSAYIGACPIPQFAGLPNLIHRILASKFMESEEYAKLNENWAQLSEVSIENNQLKLVRN